MSTSLSSVLQVSLAWVFNNVLDLSTVPDNNKHKITETLTNGTSDNQANDMWHDRRYLTPASPTDDLDLAGGLTNAFGQTLTFTKIREIIVVNKGVQSASHTVWTPTSGEDIDIGGAASNPFTDLFNGSATAKITIPSGGIFVATAPIDGWVVTAGSADVLRVALGAASPANEVDYDIIIVGTD